MRKPRPRPKGLLQVINVTYRHSGANQPILVSVDFSLEPGETLGIIGPMAAGMTTLARLLTGDLQPNDGRILLDGTDLAEWRREDLSRYIGYLPQDVELFGKSIAENIAVSAISATPEAIVEAARAAGVHDMILQLDRGYDTRKGENGNMLSAGQRQRIGLAKAPFGNPAVVVLDNPNSNLDAPGDEALTQAILGLKARGATVVVMAHRPSTIAAVDKLLMLRDGRVEAFGPKEEVLAQVTKPIPNVERIWWEADTDLAG